MVGRMEGGMEGEVAGRIEGGMEGVRSEGGREEEREGRTSTHSLLISIHRCAVKGA